jgi:hypothetical protein
LIPGSVSSRSGTVTGELPMAYENPIFSADAAAHEESDGIQGPMLRFLKTIHLESILSIPSFGQGCQIFLCTAYQNEEKIYQMTTKYSNWL